MQKRKVMSPDGKARYRERTLVITIKAHDSAIDGCDVYIHNRNALYNRYGSLYMVRDCILVDECLDMVQRIRYLSRRISLRKESSALLVSVAYLPLLMSSPDETLERG